MPRTYKSKVKGRQLVKHDEVQIARATAAIMKGTSYKAAEKKFGIPVTVLHRRIKTPQSKDIGGQPALGEELESTLTDKIIICANWGYPLTKMDLRLLVKGYLDRRGVKHAKFINNFPGQDWARSFLKRHKAQLADRMCQNIKRARASVSRDVIQSFFDELEVSLTGVPASHIVNNDETNLTDDPGSTKVIVRRGAKHPERVMNSTKACTSLMFAGTADGKLLPPYVVYKATHLYDTWTEGGPDGARFNRSKSGWFDAICFSDWFFKIALPYLRKLDGRKILIGDNLASHLSMDVISECEKHNIGFIFLPPNSTHMTQPLDVAFFRPLKIAWRSTLEAWKIGSGRSAPCVSKDAFPSLLKELMEKIEPNAKANLKSGFAACGITPINREKVLSRLPVESPETEAAEGTEAVNDSLTSLLKDMRYETVAPRKKRKLNVPAGKSVTSMDCHSESEPEDGSQTQNNTSIESVHSVTEDRTVDATEQETFPAGLIPPQLSGVKKGDWVLVDFGGTSASSSRKRRMYLGKIERKAKQNEFEGLFLRESYRGDGSTFSFPVKADKSMFSFSQIIGTTPDPQELRRGVLKFNFNIKNMV